MGRPNAFDGTIREFCVKLGWCGCVTDGKRLHVSNFIPETGPVSADEFARWLIAAERLSIPTNSVLLSADAGYPN